MQRIGRVDRRMNPEIEQALCAQYPSLANSRNTVIYWNFLPPEELDSLLRLYQRVNSKTLVISRMFGIEGRQLLKPDDTFDPVREINEQYEGQESDSEALRLEYQQLVQEHPELAAELPRLPLKLFSGKQATGQLRGCLRTSRILFLGGYLVHCTIENGYSFASLDW
jgi:hypothetical protein